MTPGEFTPSVPPLHLRVFRQADADLDRPGARRHHASAPDPTPVRIVRVPVGARTSEQRPPHRARSTAYDSNTFAPSPRPPQIHSPPPTSTDAHSRLTEGAGSLSIAVIGAGRIGHVHAKTIAAHPRPS